MAAAGRYLSKQKIPNGVGAEGVRTQQAFLQAGGLMQIGLSRMWEAGELPEPGFYEHQEYPKALSFSLGRQSFPRETEDVKGRTLTWVEEKEVFFAPIVEDEDEEARVTAAFNRAREISLTIEPHWRGEDLVRAVNISERARRVASRSSAATVDAGPAEDAKAARIASLKAELAALDLAPEETPAVNALVTDERSRPSRVPRRHTADVVAPDPAGV